MLEPVYLIHGPPLVFRIPGFNVYTADGFVDMSLWLAFRDAVALVAPHEGLVLDGTPSEEGALFALDPSAVVSAMVAADRGSMLIASSSLPHNRQSGFSVRAPPGTDTTHWLLCNLQNTSRSVAAGADGAASWAAKEEAGTLLLFGARTPCHGAGRHESL